MIAVNYIVIALGCTFDDKDTAPTPIIIVGSIVLDYGIVIEGNGGTKNIDSSSTIESAVIVNEIMGNGHIRAKAADTSAAIRRSTPAGGSITGDDAIIDGGAAAHIEVNSAAIAQFRRRIICNYAIIDGNIRVENVDTTAFRPTLTVGNTAVGNGDRNALDIDSPPEKARKVMITMFNYTVIERTGV